MNKFNDQEIQILLEELAKIKHSADQSKELLNFINQFAKNQGYNTVIQEDNLFIVLPSTEENEKNAPMTLQTSLDLKTSSNSNIKNSAIASILYLLKNNTFRHPKIYITLTGNKNNSFNGAQILDENYIKDSKHLINLNPKALSPFVIKSPGSEVLKARYDYSPEVVLGKFWIITVENLTGGDFYSNKEITAANSVKILSQILGHFVQTSQIRLIDFTVESDMNDIPTTAKAAFYSPHDKDTLLNYFIQIGKIIAVNYQMTDKDIKIDLKQQKSNNKVSCFSRKDTANIIFGLSYYPYGIELKDPNYVLCSNNISAVHAGNGKVEIVSKLFFLNKAAHEYIKNRLIQFIVFTGGIFNLSDLVIPWRLNENSKFLEIFPELKNAESTEYETVDLENSIFKQKMEDLDIITLGIDRQKEHSNLDPTKYFLERIKTIISSLYPKQETGSVKIERSDGQVIPLDEFYENQVKEIQSTNSNED